MRRSKPMIDGYINKKVKVTLTDNTVHEGILDSLIIVGTECYYCKNETDNERVFTAENIKEIKEK